jgi:hypothetical protein
MKLDFSLYFISLLFALLGLLLEEFTSAGTQWIALLRYLPLLVLYAKYFRLDFASFLPVIFALYLFSLSFLGGHYNMIGMVVTAMLPVTLFVYTKIVFSRKQISLIFLMVLAAYFLYVIIAFAGHIPINPNQVSFKILLFTVVLFFCIYTNSKRRIVINTIAGRKRAIGVPGLYFLLGLSFLLILLTKGRNSLLVYLLLFAAFLVRNKVAKWDKWGFILSGLLVIYVVYPFVYCLLSSGMKGQTEMMGQDVFSGREIIWSYIFAQVTDPMSFIFGKIDTEWWNKSMHNSALDIVVRYGVPTMVIIELIILYYFKKYCTITMNNYKPLLILIIVTMIWGVNESGLFLGFAFFLFLPCCILHSKNRRGNVVPKTEPGLKVSE